MKKYILTLGLNDKITLKQMDYTDVCKKDIAHIISNYTNGATLTEKTGFYKHINGKLTFETCIQIELTIIKKSVVLEIANLLKKHFNQEAVLLEIVNTNIKLI